MKTTMLALALLASTSMTAFAHDDVDGPFAHTNPMQYLTDGGVTDVVAGQGLALGPFEPVVPMGVSHPAGQPVENVLAEKEMRGIGAPRYDAVVRVEPDVSRGSSFAGDIAKDKAMGSNYAGTTPVWVGTGSHGEATNIGGAGVSHKLTGQKALAGQ